ncbi:hypothetical protein T190820D02B_20471 [Tenacibaculum sp. 190524A05c]
MYLFTPNFYVLNILRHYAKKYKRERYNYLSLEKLYKNLILVFETPVKELSIESLVVVTKNLLVVFKQLQFEI